MGSTLLKPAVPEALLKKVSLFLKPIAPEALLKKGLSIRRRKGTRRTCTVAAQVHIHVHVPAMCADNKLK